MSDFFGLPFWVGLILGWLLLGRLVNQVRAVIAK